MGKIGQDIYAEAKATENRVIAFLRAHILIVIAVSLVLGIIIGAAVLK